MQGNGTLHTAAVGPNYEANTGNCFIRQLWHSSQEIEQLYSVYPQSNSTPQAWQQSVTPSQPGTVSNIIGFVPARHLPSVAGHQIQSNSARSNSPLIQWLESTLVPVIAASASDQIRSCLQTVQHQTRHGDQSTQTAIPNLTNAFGNSRGPISNHAQVLEHQNRTLTSSNGGLSSTAGHQSGGGQDTMAVEANPKSSTRSQPQILRNPSYPLIMTGAPPVGAVSGESQGYQFIELANSQTVYEAPQLAMSRPQYQTAMQPPIQGLVTSSQPPHCPGSEQYAMSFEDDLFEMIQSQNLSGPQAFQITSGSRFVASANHQNNDSGFQHPTPISLRSGPQEFGVQLYADEKSKIVEAWHQQDSGSEFAQLPHRRSTLKSRDSVETKWNSTPVAVSVHSDVKTVGQHPQSSTQENPLTTANSWGDSPVAFKLLEMSGSTAVWVPLEAATATVPLNTVGITEFKYTQQQVGTSLGAGKADFVDSDGIRTFAKKFRRWRSSRGLGSLQVSLLLEEANGAGVRYSKRTMGRFEKSDLPLEYANKIKLELQKVMASYKPVSVGTASDAGIGGFVDPDGIIAFAGAFKRWRSSRGLSRHDVSLLLEEAKGETYSRDTISRFENSDMSLKHAKKIKLVLQKLMASYEPVPGSTRGVRRILAERNSLSPDATELLNEFFRVSRHPTPSEITKLAEDLAIDETIIRRWFRNSRNRKRDCVNHQESLRGPR